MMQRIFKVIVCLLLIVHNAFSQGKVIHQKFTAASLLTNKAGENPQRDLSIYLPPSYSASSNKTYPVIYFLHGYYGTDKEYVEWLQLQQLMDSAIEAKIIRPVIMVFPNSNTKYMGSFYSNSIMGNWADFIAKDVVNWIDKNYKTIPHPSSRGISGHSMGGNGCLKIAMQFSSTFSSVYALSPAVLNWQSDFTLSNKAFQRVSSLQQKKNLINAADSIFAGNDLNAFYAGVITAMAMAYSPNEKKEGIPVNLPVSYIADSAIYHTDVIQQWQMQFPFYMIDSHLPQLKKLKAIKFDWGRNEEFTHIPFTALQFSKKLESYGIKHYAEEYLGNHGNMIGGYNGRFFTEVLPFFNTNLAW